MLLTVRGKPLAISSPNPLMATQGVLWDLSRGTYIDWDLFGDESVEKQPNRYSNLDAVAQKALQRINEQSSQHIEEPPRRSRRQEPSVGLDLYGEGTKEDDAVIRNTDGTPYKPSGKADMYDPCSPDHALNDQVDQESIALSGAWIEYYRVMIDGRMDDLYLEQRQKVFLQKPWKIKAVYDPVTPQLQFGGTASPIFDSIEEITFYFNRKEFIDLVGELPRVGSLIKTCDEGVWWEVMENQINFSDGERKIWGKHRIGCACRKYRPVITDRSPSEQGREQAESGRTAQVRIR